MSDTDDGLGSRYYTAPGNALAAGDIARRMAEFGLNVWHEDFIAGDGTYATNVVGELPGRDPSKLYLVAAHDDSMSAAGGNAPGADDNASGVAAMLEIARIFSGYQLAHPVRFVALTGEEVGFQGAGAFVTRAEATGTTFIAAFNLDALGWPGRPTGLVINGDDASYWIENLLARIDVAFGLGEELLIRQNPDIVADDSVWRRAGIPTVLVTRSVYGESAIHHTADDVIERLDLDLVAGATTLVLFTLGDLVAIYDVQRPGDLVRRRDAPRLTLRLCAVPSSAGPILPEPVARGASRTGAPSTAGQSAFRSAAAPPPPAVLAHLPAGRAGRGTPPPRLPRRAATGPGRCRPPTAPSPRRPS